MCLQMLCVLTEIEACVPDQDLLAFINNRFPAEEAAFMCGHLQICDPCAERAKQLGGNHLEF